MRKKLTTLLALKPESFSESSLSEYHADTPITIKAEAFLKADSRCN